MPNEPSASRVARRTFLSRLTAGAAAFGTAFGGSSRLVLASQAAAQSPFQPARHPEDDWYDETQAKHRFFQDTTSAEALSSAMGFARNFFEANISGYHLTDPDIAQIICLRHRSTPFAFNDAMWAKYGAMLSERANNFLDPKTKQAPTVNIYETEGGRGSDGTGITLTALNKRGVRYAVCAMSTRRAATVIAQKNNGKVEDINQELIAHLVPGGHMVAAGIVAVNRAQEHGYTASSVY